MSNYLLLGMVSVMNGVTLTIEAGTVIFGDFNTIGFLNVEHGGKLIAIGTADAPIILTSDRQPGQMAPGDFGGLLMSGRAVANCADCLGGESYLSEGADVLYCGDDDCDAAGVHPIEVASGFDIRTVPNPVVDNAGFHFNLPENGRTRVSIFDIAGRQVDSLVDADLAAGSHMVSWNVPDNMPSGT